MTSARWAAAWMVIAVGCAAPRPTTKPVFDFAGIDVPVDRLPHTFEPTGYRVRLALGQKALLGNIDITGDLASPSQLIWLHAEGIVVTRALAIRDGHAVELQPKMVHRFDSEVEVLALQAATPLAPGRWTLSLTYTAAIDDKGVVEERNEHDFLAPTPFPAAGVVREGPYVFTMFEPWFARRAFPCIDEPDRKVPWQLTLDVATNLVAASNTPIIEDVALDATHRRITFAPTPPLPSYLVAFAVGPFHVVDGGRSKSGVPIRLLVTSNHAADAVAPARVIAGIVDAIEDYLQVPFPYPKLDLVAIPHSGDRWRGMENAGLVTFDVSNLRSPDGARSLFEHEIAHQWFGDLVTLAWWTDLWLNESFAVWMTQKLGQGRDGVLTNVRRGVTSARWDWLSGRRQEPVSVRAPLAHVKSIEALQPYFGGDRGALVLEMLEGLYGEQQFQRAIHAYLTAHLHGTVSSSDLFVALPQLGGQRIDATLARVIDSNDPPATISFDLQCKPSHVTVTLSQPETKPIPVCFAHDSDGKRIDHCVILDGAKLELPLNVASCPRWLLPNRGDGFYESNWTPANLDALATVGWVFLTLDEREHLMSELDEVEALRFVPRWLEATDPHSKGIAAQLLIEVSDYVPDDLGDILRATLSKHFAAAARALHFDAKVVDDHFILGIGAKLRDPGLVRDAIDHVSQSRTTGTRPNLSALRLAVSGDPALADRMFTALSSTNTNEDAADALAHSSEMLAVIRRNPGKLTKLPAVRRDQLLVGSCESTRRADVAALAKELHESWTLEPLFERCDRRRKALEPAFRAWLGKPKKP